MLEICKTRLSYIVFLFILIIPPCMTSCEPDLDIDDENPIPTPLPQGNITSFQVEMQLDGRKNPLNVQGVFNEDSTIITLKPIDQYWIYNVESLIATFTSNGVVSVGGKVQTSGVSANDFSKELNYSVLATDGIPREYVVKLVAPQSTGLPVIKINTEDNAPILDKINYVPATIKVVDANNAKFEVEATGGIRGRGNSTWWFDKKPYRIKFDKKTSLFGLGAAKSWVLLANYLDHTFIMNTVTFEIGRRLDIPFTNHVFHVELFLNNKYQGSYALSEQVQVHQSRINIDEKTAFLVELDQNYDKEYQFRTNRLQLPVMVKSPELNDMAEMQPIIDVMQEFEDVLFDPALDFPNNHYKELIDINSLIDYMIVNEVVRNGEVFHPKSVFMYKEANGKLTFGPLWDFDWAFGYTGTGHKYFDYYNKILFKQNYSNKQLFNQFLKDPYFREQYKNRWNEVLPKISNMEPYILNLAESLKKSQVENEVKWKTRLDYDEEINKMIDWLNRRIAFLDEEINRF